MAATPTILVIGSLNIDLVTRTSRIPAAGETLSASSFSTGYGGKGANQAVACARLSRTKATIDDPTVRVRMAGAVGNDVYGPGMVAALKDVGIETDDILTVDDKDTPTGTAVIIVETATGENRILLNAGANFTLRPEAFKNSLSLSSSESPKPDLVILQLEIPLDTTVAILHTAKEQGVPVLWNPAPAIKLPLELYKLIDTLVVNETEAAILLGDEVKLDLESEDGLKAAADHYLSLGVRVVLITLGGNGVYHASKTSFGLVKGLKVKVVDTTAAGDTFIGAYAVATLKGQSNESAVKSANRAAAITVGRLGAQDSIPFLDEVPAE